MGVGLSVISFVELLFACRLEGMYTLTLQCVCRYFSRNYIYTQTYNLQ